MKPVTFSMLKKIQKMTLNQFNIFAQDVYKTGVQDGIDAIEKETVAEMDTDELYRRLLSVKGVGVKLADKIMDAIMEEKDGYKVNISPDRR